MSSLELSAADDLDVSPILGLLFSWADFESWVDPDGMFDVDASTSTECDCAVSTLTL